MLPSGRPDGRKVCRLIFQSPKFLGEGHEQKRHLLNELESGEEVVPLSPKDKIKVISGSIDRMCPIS